MKKYLLIAAVLAFAAQPLTSICQPTIDGSVGGDTEYTTLDVASSRDGYGAGNDLGVIKYYTDGTNIYIAITGELNDANNIVLFFDFSGYGGRPAGNDLDPGGNYEGFVGVFNKAGGSGLDGAKMDMEVDFALAFNEGGGTSQLFVDGARYGSTDILNTSSLGSVMSQTGTSGMLDFSSSFGGTGMSTVAYRNTFDSNSDHGIEMAIPISSFAGVDNTQSLRLFAIITNQTGEMSNESIPGDLGPANLGNDADLSAIAGQDLFTSTFLLPVDFNSLGIERFRIGHKLTFSTSTETNNSHFNIERSIDSRRWETLGHIAGAGTTQEQQEYSFLDKSPESGTNYYRIKQVDFDGTFSYSKIVSAVWGTKPKITTYPNPASEQLQIQGLETVNDQTIQIEVINLQGQILLQQNWNQEAVSVRQLPKGSYLIRVRSGDEVLAQERVIIQ